MIPFHNILAGGQ
ncbi:hypothetical protein YPPY04_2053, partial [Yersinia pestis PY-04]